MRRGGLFARTHLQHQTQATHKQTVTGMAGASGFVRVVTDLRALLMAVASMSMIQGWRKAGRQV